MVLAILLVASQQPHFVGQWPGDFGRPAGKAATLAQLPAKTQTIVVPARTAGPNGKVIDLAAPSAPPSTYTKKRGPTYGTPESTAYYKELDDRERSARTALADLRPNDVVTLLTKPSTHWPAGDVVDADLLADAYLRLGRVDDAYHAMELQGLGPGAREDTLIRASFIAALRGEVYRGQREFLVHSLSRFDENNGATWIPEGYKPREIALLSAIVLGRLLGYNHDDPNEYFYMSEALKLEPTNYAAAKACGYIMIQLGHYHEAKRILTAAEYSGSAAETRNIQHDLWIADWYIGHPKAKANYHFGMRDPFPNLK